LELPVAGALAPDAGSVRISMFPRTGDPTIRRTGPPSTPSAGTRFTVAKSAAFAFDGYGRRDGDPS